MKTWLLPVAVFALGCMATGDMPSATGRSRMADDNLRLAEADSFIVRMLATVPGCAEAWKGRANWEEGLVFRVAPIPPQYVAINMCEKKNRVFISLLHVDDLDAAEIARIMVHEAAHQAYCEYAKPFDKEESERIAKREEEACFPPTPEEIGVLP